MRKLHACIMHALMSLLSPHCCLNVLQSHVCTCCLQVCGEATYVDDMKMHGMLHAALVVSSRPHAKILNVDASAAVRVRTSPYWHA